MVDSIYHAAELHLEFIIIEGLEMWGCNIMCHCCQVRQKMHTVFPVALVFIQIFYVILAYGIQVMQIVNYKIVHLSQA